MTWKLLLSLRNETSEELEIGHRHKTGLYKRDTSKSLTTLLLSSSRRLFSFNQLHKLQTDHRHGRLSTTSLIMPNAEEENSQSGSPGVSGPVATLDNQPSSLSRPTSALLVDKVIPLETQVAQILSLLQNRPAGTAPTATTAEDPAAPPAPPAAE